MGRLHVFSDSSDGCLLTGPTGWDKGEDSLLLVLCFRSNLPQCQDWAKGLHSRWVKPNFKPSSSVSLYHIATSLMWTSPSVWQTDPLSSPQGECIQIFADVENCSSRVVVPKAALYQNQTFFAKGKGKQIQQLVSNLRGDPLPQGKSQSWEGKLLKIPPVSPSILDCPIIKVEYALVVSGTDFFSVGCYYNNHLYSKKR